MVRSFWGSKRGISAGAFNLPKQRDVIRFLGREVLNQTVVTFDGPNGQVIFEG
jgi:hypothetical protein